MGNYLKKERIENSNTGKYKYKYFVKCSSCSKEYWTKTFYKDNKIITCKSCAGKQSYTPSKVKRKDTRKRGQGYITKQGYHLIYDGTKYVCAHRIPFPDIKPEEVVHHIDGDKLNNTLQNLVVLTKSHHRDAHHSLEFLAYELIKVGLITYNKDNNLYSMSSSMTKIIELISVNSGKPQTDDAVGNPEPSHVSGRCNDYPIEEYIISMMEARNTQTDGAVGDDIVSSA